MVNDTKTSKLYSMYKRILLFIAGVLLRSDVDVSYLFKTNNHSEMQLFVTLLFNIYNVQVIFSFGTQALYI